MGRTRGKGSGAKKAKKAANDREETKKFFNQRELGPPPTQLRRARAPAPKLKQFAGIKFNKDDEKHTAVVDAAIAAARKAGHRESKDLVPYVWNATRFMKKNRRGRKTTYWLSQYVYGQCAAEDRTRKAPPWWDGIADIVTAEDEKLLEFVKRKDVVVAVKSCCGKTVYYGDDLGLRPRGSIAYSVEEYGLDGATRLARRETYTTLGVIEEFEKQLKKLK